MGDPQGAAREFEAATELARSLGGLIAAADLGYSLSGAATLYVMAGDTDAAIRCATEGLAIARDTQVPSLIVTSLAALAGALVDQDHGRAEALLRESVELRAHLDYETGDDLTQAVFISARLDDWSLTLDLASRAIPMLQWRDDRTLLGAVFNVVARAIVATDPIGAAVLQGAAKHLTPIRAPATDAPAPTERIADRPAGPASFVTRWRRDTASLLHESLDGHELHERRAEGETMSTDQAVAYALDAITHVQQRARS